MDVGWVGRADVGGLKPQMIVAMSLLCLAAGMHEVHLCSDLIVRSEPCLADCRDGGVGEIIQKHFGRGFTELLQ